MIPDIGDALLSLAPGASWSHGGNYDSIVWYSDDVPKPSKRRVNAELKRLMTEHNDNEYRRQRAVAYPPIGDQLDDLLKQGAFSDEMQARLLAIKEQFPKT